MRDISRLNNAGVQLRAPPSASQRPPARGRPKSGAQSTYSVRARRPQLGLRLLGLRLLRGRRLTGLPTTLERFALRRLRVQHLQLRQRAADLALNLAVD